jgi:ribonuclease P protein component
VLIVLSNEIKISRVGIIAGKSLGNAVDRNRIKRQLRACMTSILSEVQGYWDIVLIPRPAVIGSDFSALEKSLRNVLHRSGLIEKNE